VATPPDWRERWASDAARHYQSPPPQPVLDPPELAAAEPRQLVDRNLAGAEAALHCTLLALERASSA
jgi:hypothetical protein